MLRQNTCAHGKTFTRFQVQCHRGVAFLHNNLVCEPVVGSFICRGFAREGRIVAALF